MLVLIIVTAHLHDGNTHISRACINSPSSAVPWSLPLYTISTMMTIIIIVFTRLHKLLLFCSAWVPALVQGNTLKRYVDAVHLAKPVIIVRVGECVGVCVCVCVCVCVRACMYFVHMHNLKCNTDVVHHANCVRRRVCQRVRVRASACTQARLRALHSYRSSRADAGGACA